MDSGVVRQVDTWTWIVTLFVIIAEILPRFQIPNQLDFAVNPVDIEQLAPQPFQPRPRLAPVVHGCDQRCCSCDQYCHRHKSEHSQHSTQWNLWKWMRRTQAPPPLQPPPRQRRNKSNNRNQQRDQCVSQSNMASKKKSDTLVYGQYRCVVHVMLHHRTHRIGFLKEMMFISNLRVDVLWNQMANSWIELYSRAPSVSTCSLSQTLGPSIWNRAGDTNSTGVHRGKKRSHSLESNDLHFTDSQQQLSAFMCIHVCIRSQLLKTIINIAGQKKQAYAVFI